MINPHAQLKKLCKHCGKEFTTTAYFNKEYDTAQCRRLAKRQRYAKRNQPSIEKDIDKQHEQFAEVNRFFATVFAPTPTQLDNYTKTILLGLNEGKPIRILGKVPDWTPPKGVELISQHTQPPEWILVAREVSPLDELLKR